MLQPCTYTSVFAYTLMVRVLGRLLMGELDKLGAAGMPVGVDDGAVRSMKLQPGIGASIMSVCFGAR